MQANVGTAESLGIRGIEAVHYYVRDLERSRRFYTERLEFYELGRSDEALGLKSHQQSAVFQAGNCVVICSQPMGEGGRAWRYLRKHPDGIGSIIFEVSDIEKTFHVLERRGGTMITDILHFEENGGRLSTFNITTPFGDTTFRFVQRDGYRPLFPGMIPFHPARGGNNGFGFVGFDHITSNFQTMMPALLWMEHVMGFRHYWNIQFHTDDVAKSSEHGSGLRSAVMWDEASGVKFANNEPFRPFFKSSQINIFNEDNRGDGVQHIALAVSDIVSAVSKMREAGVQFLPTPGSYYDELPERIRRMNIQRIDEKVEDLRALEILVDGDKEHSYLLQIFMKDSAALYHDPDAGPFFFEIIQRKGDSGFGGGNFRALFESIERQQRSTGKG
jgi:4-hydroxyphenylpyruvate dioxygenase